MSVAVAAVVGTLGVAAGAVPRQPVAYQPAAASFLSPRVGWLLRARVPMAGTCNGCLEIVKTVDGGRAWTSLPSPPARFSWSGIGGASHKRVRRVSFANPSDGYLFDPGLLVTDDGGRHWQSPNIRGASSVAAVGGRVLVLVATASARRAQLWSARIGSAHFRELRSPAKAGRVPQLVADGNTVLLLQPGDTGADPTPTDLGRLWTSTDGGTTWQSRVVPCSVRDGGAAVVAIETGAHRHWLIDCYDNLQSSQQLDTQHHLYLTTDAGNRWTRLSDPTHRGEPVGLAANATGQLLLATESAGDAVFASLDGGWSWHTALEDGGDFFGFDGPRFVTPTFAYLVAPTHDVPSRLYLTDDAGRTWHTDAAAG